MNPSVIIPSENLKKDWILRNIAKMMNEIIIDARKCRPLPLAITMHGVALKKFVEVLKSKAMFLKDPSGKITFLNIPIYENNRLPLGSFVVERHKLGKGMLLKNNH